METKLSLNQEVLITIKTIGINGEGIGFYKRQAVFVPGVMPPEEVVVKIKTLKPGYAEGEVVRIKKKAFYRVKPYHANDPKCPNCTLQHVAYEEQQRLKEDLLKQSFERYTSLNLKQVKFHRFNPMVTPKHYLKTVLMPVKDTDDGLVTVMRDPMTKKETEVMDCPLHDQTINDVNRMVLEILDGFQVFAFNEKTKKGMLRHLITRRSFSTNEVQVTMVITIFNKVLKKAAQKILDIPDVVSVAISKNHDVKNKEPFGDTIEVLAGKKTIEDKLGDVRLQLSANAYFPHNPQEAQQLYAYVKTLLNPDDKQVLDLYSGSGGMSLYLADKVENITAVDHDVSSVNNARYNARLNRVDNIEFIDGDVVETYHKLTQQKKSFDVAIFDPQRFGLHKGLVTMLLKKPIKRLIYISNNPSTLAKDINVLCKQYKLVSVMPFDMAPQTAQVDAVAVLERK